MSYRFDPGSGLIVLPVHILGPLGGATVNLALDTGASTSVISWGTLTELGYDPAAAPVRSRITTGSELVVAPIVTVDQIETLGKGVTQFSMLCHTLPPSATVDSVLGLDFCRAPDW